MNETLEQVSVRTRCRIILSDLAEALLVVESWPPSERGDVERHLVTARKAIEEIVYGDVG